MRPCPRAQTEPCRFTWTPSRRLLLLNSSRPLYNVSVSHASPTSYGLVSVAVDPYTAVDLVKRPTSLFVPSNCVRLEASKRNMLFNTLTSSYLLWWAVMRRRAYLITRHEATSSPLLWDRSAPPSAAGKPFACTCGEAALSAIERTCVECSVADKVLSVVTADPEQKPEIQELVRQLSHDWLVRELKQPNS